MEKLIINKRHELPKTKRIVWDLITVLLWIGFIYLWKPVFHVFYRIITLGAPAEELSDWIFGEIHSVTFEHALYMLIGTPIVLFILSRLNRHQAPSEHLLYESSDYSNYFHVNDAELQQCVNSQLITVFHNEHGHIIRLENQITNK
ncbi:MAG: poly-beta-1,6-N-acetyl-D-glucosamine biosynthesis protein PgaD [Sulfuricurvum sp.]|uniref:poly-beta-1,6-N-acetyl-D-glucosamine biosynthesis protein PgaD n=1 Tax=Sulfuricurvum sp. TaxID=2025608 RepID=UPI0026040A4F|nr:poly-beta-1,6-N-acetyl-D-glucosamine biosynthesis protein PgaD [Sulfuricurvum sp.]MDD2369394.1 poly-beta-1,6-N-acetyl-D-glucosamine biosynthesis protein PgaD [Sulfuricurvum sp.]MDD2949288.1 poly-beta-1,6-N-acetyl-D-glucosamine biosynthesis protein PgaD [Sulfuricurvum sp.]MDD5119308.1 poly-beta-1,6-N-acetyl-D-glucosamine biosynthesis protein PgaD [Sulfuricurvum sp.]